MTILGYLVWALALLVWLMFGGTWIWYVVGLLGLLFLKAVLKTMRENTANLEQRVSDIEDYLISTGGTDNDPDPAEVPTEPVIIEAEVIELKTRRRA